MDDVSIPLADSIKTLEMSTDWNGIYLVFDFIAIFFPPPLSEMLPGITLSPEGVETGEGVNDSRGSRDRSHGSLRMHIGFFL